MKLLIISHGDFAAGITSTLKTFFQIENVYSACVTQEGGPAICWTRYTDIWISGEMSWWLSALT